MSKSCHARPLGTGRCAELSVFSTTDLHAHILPYDYYRDCADDNVGLSRVVQKLTQLRAQADHSILLDNGDFLNGNPLSDHFAQNPQTVHPVIGAMNRVGYDAVALGNHEFDFGLEFLSDSLRHADFPVLCSNAYCVDQNTSLQDPFVILDRQLTLSDGSTQLIKVGIIGFVPPQISDWREADLSGRIKTQDIVQAAREHVPKMRDLGADIVIALCHTGIGPQTYQPNMENAAIPLAALDGIDVLITGHIHAVFPGRHIRETENVDPVAGTLHGKPVVMAGFYGSHLGAIDLQLNWDGANWTITDHQVMAHDLRQAPLDPTSPASTDLVQSFQPFHNATLQHIRQPIGHTSVPISSHFAMTGQASCLDLIADAQRHFAQNTRFIQNAEDLPILSAVTAYKCGGHSGPNNFVDIPAGPISLNHAAQLYMFNDDICILEVTGAELADWLERSASIFGQITPGLTMQNLIAPDAVSYCFDVIDGLDYSIDPSASPKYRVDGRLIDPANQRICALQYQGRDVTPADRFYMVSNSYRVSGGGYFAAAQHAKVVLSATVSCRDALINYIKSKHHIAPAPRKTWRFARIPWTRAQFETGICAPRYGQPDHLRYVGRSPRGFDRYELEF